MYRPAEQRDQIRRGCSMRGRWTHGGGWRRNLVQTADHHPEMRDGDLP